MRGPSLGKRILIGGGVAVLLSVIAFAPVLPASLACGKRRVLVDCDAATSAARRTLALAEVRAFGDRLTRQRHDLDVEVRDTTEEPYAPDWIRVLITRRRWFDQRLDGVEIVRVEQGPDLERLDLERYSSTKRGSSLVGFLMSPTDPAVVHAVDAECDRIEEILHGRTPPAAE